MSDSNDLIKIKMAIIVQKEYELHSLFYSEGSIKHSGREWYVRAALVDNVEEEEGRGMRRTDEEEYQSQQSARMLLRRVRLSLSLREMKRT